MHRMDADEEDAYRAALRHVQREPVWGGSEDTAGPLRATAAFALVRMNPRDLVVLLADLLADPDKVARSGAAKALGALGRRPRSRCCGSRRRWATRSPRSSWTA